MIFMLSQFYLNGSLSPGIAMESHRLNPSTPKRPIANLKTAQEKNLTFAPELVNTLILLSSHFFDHTFFNEDSC